MHRAFAILILMVAASHGRLDAAEDHGGITLPEGFRAVVVAERTGPARHLAVRNNGDVFVAMRRPYRGGGVAALRDARFRPMGLAEGPDGSLYIADSRKGASGG